jgi:uncharacterized membrane protein YeaQ/YmgE (transglycosylase-associated protein family)
MEPLKVWRNPPKRVNPSRIILEVKMEILILIAAMVVVGLIIGFLAGIIWKGERPIGVKGDYIVAVISAVVIGLIDWFVIPAMGFSDTVKWLGILTEPALGALLVLWVIRLARK